MTRPRSLKGTRDAAGKTKTPVRVAAAGAEGKKLLADANRMLRAERFAEAREMFEKLTKSKRERGQALVGLAEISFQEKKYADAARSAELAADRGGGVKARVLLGDAHFRLARYKEAAKAYEDALKIDPGNASAKSGLALANKRDVARAGATAATVSAGAGPAPGRGGGLVTSPAASTAGDTSTSYLVAVIVLSSSSMQTRAVCSTSAVRSAISVSRLAA